MKRSKDPTKQQCCAIVFTRDFNTAKGRKGKGVKKPKYPKDDGGMQCDREAEFTHNGYPCCWLHHQTATQGTRRIAFVTPRPLKVR